VRGRGKGRNGREEGSGEESRFRGGRRGVGGDDGRRCGTGMGGKLWRGGM